MVRRLDPIPCGFIPVFLKGPPYLFRPAYIQPTAGLKNTLKFYTALSWLFPALKFLMPGYACTLKEVGLAMINAVRRGYDKSILEVRDIILLAKS
jgi:hypothetical protein